MSHYNVACCDNTPPPRFCCVQVREVVAEMLAGTELDQAAALGGGFLLRGVCGGFGTVVCAWAAGSKERRGG